MTRDLLGVQLSVAITWEVKSGTTAWQFASAETVTGPGQEPTGGVVSATITVTLLWEESPQASVTLRVTTLVPIGRATVRVAEVPRTLPAEDHSYVSGPLPGLLECDPSRVTWD